MYFTGWYHEERDEFEDVLSGIFPLECVEWLDESLPASAEQEAEKLYPYSPESNPFKKEYDREADMQRSAHMYIGEIERLKTLIKDFYESEVAEPCRNAGAADDLIEKHWQEFKAKHSL